jgi:ABC-type glycerol-3-phosphate transport system substrate-binding protein
MSTSRKMSRRRALGLAAAASTLPLVHMRTAGAAGKLSVGFWDHWVPQGNDVMRKQVQAWAAQNKVDVSLDFITSSGNKLLVTIAAEAQARAGHDLLTFFPTWEVQNHSRELESLDDVIASLESKYGKLDDFFRALAIADGHWRAVPAAWGSQYKGPCGRLDLFKQHCGIDLQAMYPAKPVHTALSDAWTYEGLFLKAAEASKKIGKPFGIGLGTTADSVDTAGSIFASFGAQFVDAKGNITLKSDNTRRALEFFKKFVPLLPPDVYSFDDATDNRMLIADQTTMIYNPPSAWAVALRDAPKVAEQCWTFPTPAGPAGRFMPMNVFQFGVWSFSRNKSAAKDLIVYLMQREQVQQRLNVTLGFDIPPFDSMLDFDVWEKAGPPPGTLYNYPVRPIHQMKRWITGMPAPPAIAVQIYNQALPCNLVAKVTQAGQSIEQAIAWAESELESYSG